MHHIPLFKPFPPAHPSHRTPHSLVLDPELQSRLGSHFERLAAGRTAGPVRPADLKEPDPAAMRFLVNLAVCNTVVPQVLEDGRFVYQVRGGWCVCSGYGKQEVGASRG